MSIFEQKIFIKLNLVLFVKLKMNSKVKSKKEKIFEKSIEIGLGSTSHGIPNIIKSDRKCLKVM